MKVVTTNSILADITKNIAGDKIELHSIVPVGKDPHEYEPLPEDVKKRLRKQTSSSTTGSTSKPVAMFGLLNWSKMPIKLKTKTISQLARESTSSTWKAKTKLEKKTLTLGSISKTGSSTLKNIAKQLIAKDPKNKDFYEKNLAAYTEKLSKLDQEAKQKNSTISQKRRR